MYYDIPLKIQLAVQGGGAKISALLAVMETIQTLQDEEKIQVTRVAGTSAGAIAGSLLAADVRIEAFKSYLQARRSKNSA